MLFIVKMIYQTHDNRWLFIATLGLIFSTSSLVFSIEANTSISIEKTLNALNANHSDQNEKVLALSTQSDTLIETTVVSNAMDETTANTSTTGLYLVTDSVLNSTTTTSPLVDTMMASGSENRFRWMDFRRPQAYPPRMPALPGIPSGFRNPAANSNQVFNPGMPFTGFGGSSTQPVGFGGSVVMSNHGFGPQAGSVRRPALNITRVEHITAECSDEYMKVSIHFNGTFTGLVYSSGYVHDLNCIYVNGSGRNHYEFYIRLNQCGTLGRQEMYHPTLPGEARRRDQLMWNTLSIQYNSLIEEEFDEHYRVTCEYGSDFWKTVTFPSVNVEVNTGSPVVFTINPPQCQMEIRRGFGIAGTRTSGPVTVGDPLTLLIHMKSEKTGFDILVKNCVAHNGAQQRLQLIDSSGCVTNEKLISPFRGTYNSENGHQVSLYSYLKAFRFTGSPALYLECDIHMCHNKCPPQRCYWRNLSKRSVDSQVNSTSDKPIVSESISLFQSLEVRQESDQKDIATNATSEYNAELERSNLCFRSDGVAAIIISTFVLLVLSFAMSIGCCMKMRRMKYCQRHMIDASSLYKTSYDTIYSYPHSETLHSRRF